MMSISGTVPDIRRKTQDIVVQCAGFGWFKTLKITLKTVEKRCFLHAMKPCELMPDYTFQSNDISMIFTLRNQEKTGGFDDNIIRDFQVGLEDVIRQEYKGYRWDLHLKRPAWASVIRQEAKG